MTLPIGLSCICTTWVRSAMPRECILPSQMSFLISSLNFFFFHSRTQNSYCSACSHRGILPCLWALFAAEMSHCFHAALLYDQGASPPSPPSSFPESWEISILVPPNTEIFRNSPSSAQLLHQHKSPYSESPPWRLQVVLPHSWQSCFVGTR